MSGGKESARGGVFRSWCHSRTGAELPPAVLWGVMPLQPEPHLCGSALLVPVCAHLSSVHQCVKVNLDQEGRDLHCGEIKK